MATRLDDTAKLTKKAAPAKKTPLATAKKKAAAAPNKAKPAPRKTAGSAPAQKQAAGGAEGLLRAGLKALGTVRDDVAKRQSSVTNVIEGLLGIGHAKSPDAVGAKSALPRGFPSLDTFGIRKFEDVFDQRVATAMERLGMPSAQDVQALREEVAQLRERLARYEDDNAGRRGRDSKR